MTESATLEAARKVADAVLFEGYVLYPYRASAQKNQLRWQFGVLWPPAYAQANPPESSYSRTECLLECPSTAQVDVVLRFLHVQRRAVDAIDSGSGLRPVDVLEVNGVPVTPWDEAVEQEVRGVFAVSKLISGECEQLVRVPPDDSVEKVCDREGRVTGLVSRLREPLEARVQVSAEQLPGPYGVLRLAVQAENIWGRSLAAGRDAALSHSLVAAHTIISISEGAFLSMTDPPEWAKPFIENCRNVGTWPVLVGPAERCDSLLSSPIILSDRPELAPESPGNLYDGTEIDEILTLRTMALSDAERLEVRGTDPRAAALLDQVDSMPAELMERLHGTIRYLRSVTGEPAIDSDAQGPSIAPRPTRGAGLVELGVPNDDGPTPWWDPGSDASVDPATDSIVVSGVPVASGSRVQLEPGRRRADAQDVFLAGRMATVEAVLHAVDGRVHLAVTLEDDEAADLQREEGRFLYFAPDEVRPLGSRP